jgi:hypothetical protein
MIARALAVAGCLLAFTMSAAAATDIDLCFATADRVTKGEPVSEADKQAGHEACQRALAATASLMQKQDIQEADFDIIGRPKQ